MSSPEAGNEPERNERELEELLRRAEPEPDRKSVV